MASFRGHKPSVDAFDSLDWDPDLPSAKSPDESPEHVSVKPQPVAYTTVGSVVNPNFAPQLAAPNRIQREGASRRPLLSLLQGLTQSATQHRGPPPPLNMSNSMAYAQQLGPRPAGSENSPSFSQIPRGTPSRATMPENELDSTTGRHWVDMPTLMQEQKEVLLMQYGSYPAHNPTTRTSSPVKRSKVAELSQHQAFLLKEFFGKDPHSQPSGVQGSVQGMEKMQTLQRLAKFENPMQQVARDRLSEFSVARPQPPPANPLGELNREYQFPPGMPHPQPQSNPLLGAADRGHRNAPPPSRPPGYPQPLTAGPPGQRQFPNTTSYALQISQEQWAGSDLYNASGTHQTSNPWGYEYTAQQPESMHSQRAETGHGDRRENRYNQQVANQYARREAVQHIQPSSHHSQVESYFESPYQMTQRTVPLHQGVPAAKLDCHDIFDPIKVVNTSPPSKIQRYYPDGFPDDFAADFSPMPEFVQLAMADASVEYTDEQAAAIKRKRLDDWFYCNQRRMFGMTMNDHLEELRERTEYKRNHFNPIAPPHRKFTEPVIPTPITIEEMKNMKPGAANADVMKATYGALVGLLETGVHSAGHLSGFSEPNPEHVDSEPRGNETLFGEDWGRPQVVPPRKFSNRSFNYRTKRR